MWSSRGRCPIEPQAVCLPGRAVRRGTNRSPPALQQPSRSGRRRIGATKHQLPHGWAPRAMNTTRESHDSPDPPPNPRDVHSPPSTATNKNAESRAHHRKSRPPPRLPELSGALPTRPTKAETRPGGCDAETKKNRAGERRDRRLTAPQYISWQLRHNDKTPPAEPALHQNPIRRC